MSNGPASATSSRGTIWQNLTVKEQYITQRAHGVYIALVCQLEAIYNLSVIA